MAEGIDNDAEALECAHTEQRQIAGLRKYDFVDGLVAFAREHRVPDLATNRNASRSGEASVAPGLDAHLAQQIGGQPAELRARVHQDLDGIRYPSLVLRILGNEIDAKQAHERKYGLPRCRSAN